jgi:hypothetical protein
MTEHLTTERLNLATCQDCLIIYNALLLLKQEGGQWRLPVDNGIIMAKNLSVSGIHIGIQHGFLTDGQKPATIKKIVGQLCQVFAYMK